MTQWSGSDLQRGTSPGRRLVARPRCGGLPYSTHDGATANARPPPLRRVLPCRHERGSRSAQRGRQPGAQHGETLNPYGRHGRSAAALAAAIPHAPTNFDGVTTFCRAPCDPSLSPATRHDVLAAIGTFRSLRTGNPGERAVAQAACAVINEGFYPDQSREDFVAQLHRQPPLQRLPRAAADAYVTRVADAYAVAQAHGGIARYYLRSCQIRDRGLFQRNNND